MANNMDDTDWEKCAKWLLECEVIMRDHRTLQPSADTIDLLMTLRDGVLLCQLLNHLHPRAVNLLEINYSQGRTQMSQFLCIRNIRIFLQACSSVFEIPARDLFEPLLLYEATDFHMVLHTLSKLSHTNFARSKASPFTVGGIKDQDEDIYASLPNTVDEAETEDIYDTEDIYAPIEDQEVDDIYDDLVNCRNYIKPEKETPIDRRQYCLAEIQDTEGKYVDVLNTLKNDFISPLRLTLTKEDRYKIFINIEELQKVHVSLYAEIQDCFYQGTPTIGSIFKNFRDRLLIYGEYVSKLTAAQDHVDFLCRRDGRLKELIEQCQLKANQNRFNLRALLSVPMQRVLKYHLLFGELNKLTDSSHGEKDEISEALHSMKELSDFCNEVKRDYESLEMLQQIEKSIINYQGCPIQELGRLLLDAELKIRIKAGRGSGNATQKNCFLFDKMLIVSNRSSRGFDSHEFQYSIELDKYEVTDNLPRTKGKWSYCFYLYPAGSVPNASELNSYELATKTADTMARWVNSIKMAKDNSHPHNETDHTFTYCSFPHTKATYCAVCQKLLRGMLFQGYTCTDCKSPVHKECVASSDTITCKSSRRGASQVKQSYEKVTTIATPPRPNVPPNVPLPNRVRREDLSAQPWYIEGIDRDRALQILEPLSTGTFLIRFKDSKYALSLNYNGIKHMRIYDNPGAGTFHLQESRPFETIMALVKYYSARPLNEVFNEVNTVLATPFKDATSMKPSAKPSAKPPPTAATNGVTQAKAIYDFSARDIRELSLRKGDVVQIIVQPASQRGWWKGKVDSREGYFPASYVEIV